MNKLMTSHTTVPEVVTDILMLLGQCVVHGILKKGSPFVIYLAVDRTVERYTNL